MNTKVVLSSVLFLFVFSTAVFAQKTKSEDIKVWGNCGSCKKTIEAAAVNAGASSASWSETSKMLTVSYSKKKTDQTKIQEAVAASGYDTQDFTAPADAYKKLPACCQYERKEVSNVAATDAKACCSKEASDKKDCAKEGSDKGKSCCKQ